MRKFLMCMAAIGLALGMSSTAQAAHIFASNAKINGIALGAGNAPTNPSVNVTAGVPVTFSFSVADDGTLGAGSTLVRARFVARQFSTFPSTPGAVFTYTHGSGLVTFSFTRTFTTLGTFNGYIIPDVATFQDLLHPDYKYPGGLGVAFGNNPQATPDFPDGPGLPFKLTVGPVPEPTSIALLATGAAGLFGSRFVRRRKNEKV